MLPLEEVHFEREDGKQLVHIALDILDAILLPRPYLGRNIIVDRYIRMRVYVLGYLEVETRIIHQNHRIGMPGRDVVLAQPHRSEDGAQVEQDRHKAHIGQLLVMLHPRATNGCHQVTAEETEFRLGVFLPQGRHQMRGMQVARRFADYEVILHGVRTTISVRQSNRKP